MTDTASHNSFPWLIFKTERSYKCDQCNMAFNFQQGMMDHFQNDHRMSAYYACSFCLKNFESSDLLLSHMQNQHIALYYACNKCDSEFSKTNELFHHVASHAKIEVERQCNSQPGIVAIEKRYLCCGGTCLRIFSEPSLLRSHVALHLGYINCCSGHKVSAEKVCRIDHYVDYSCGSCIKSEEIQNRCNDASENCNLVSECDDDDNSDNQDVICAKCDGKFKSMRTLRLHLRDHHKIDVMCYDEDICAKEENRFSGNFEVCGQRNKSEKIDSTSDKTHPSSFDKYTCKFMCIFCLKQFSSKQQLESHERIHSTSIDPEEKLFMSCDFCGRTFRGQINLRRHHQRCRSLKRRQDSLVAVDCCSPSSTDVVFPDSSTSSLEPQSKTGIKKEQLELTIDSSEDLSCYIQSNFDLQELNESNGIGIIKETICTSGRRQKQMTRDSVRERDRRRESQMKGMTGYVCHHCLRGFRSKTKFLDHYFEHDKSVKLFSCLACDSRFGYSSSVPKHIEMHLRDLGILEVKRGLNLCPKCGKNYRDRASLKRHEAMVHLKIGHLCLQCDKKFSSPQALKQHLRQHAGEFIFKCDSCDKRYANPSSLLNHKKTHSLNKLTCDICGRAFSLKHHLARHLARHSGFQTKPQK